MKNRTTLNSAQTWVITRCDVGTVLMHDERKTV